MTSPRRPEPPARPLAEPPGGRAPARWTPRVVLRRPLARADWLAAAGVGAGVAVGAGLVAFYLAALLRARDPR